MRIAASSSLTGYALALNKLFVAPGVWQLRIFRHTLKLNAKFIEIG
jgi:hypothetical protein